MIQVQMDTTSVSRIELKQDFPSFTHQANKYQSQMAQQAEAKMSPNFSFQHCQHKQEQPTHFKNSQYC